MGHLVALIVAKSGAAGTTTLRRKNAALSQRLHRLVTIGRYPQCGISPDPLIFFFTPLSSPFTARWVLAAPTVSLFLAGHISDTYP